MHYLEELLQYKFLQIVEKHGNGKWALDELQWLIYDKYRTLYDDLSDEDKYIVCMYIANLMRLHG